MKTAEQRRAEVTSIVEDIARIQRDPRVRVRDLGDHEAYEIVCRIEARLRAANLALP